MPQVLVGIAEVLRQAMIDHGHLDPHQVSLWVFDECHNAVRHHPFAHMLRKLHTVPEDKRGRILGLTASFDMRGDQANLVRKRKELESLMQVADGRVPPALPSPLFHTSHP